MVNPKKDYPDIVYAVVRNEDGGFSVKGYYVNKEKRIRQVLETPSDLLHFTLTKLRSIVCTNLDKEDEKKEDEKKEDEKKEDEKKEDEND